MIDIHAHLHDSAFDDDRDEVVGRAFDAGVTKIITIGTDTLESQKAVDCAEKYENVYASVGIHPHFFNEEYRIWNREYSEEKKIQEGIDIQHSTFDILSKGKEEIQNLVTDLRKIAQSSEKVVAIGECGLDYFVREGVIQRAVALPAGGASAVCEQSTITGYQKILQKEGFLAQIELAQELRLPLIIHCRPSVGTVDAYEELYHILRDQSSRFQILDSGFILHCYMGDTEVTEKFLSLPNLYFSFTGNITYPVKKLVMGTKDDLTGVVKMIPIHRILAETDCPYLAPVSYRGKRNEPAFVLEVVRKIAEIKGLSDEETMRTVEASAKKIFGI